MLVRTSNHLEVELLRWLAILAIAAGLALAFAPSVAGAACTDPAPPLASPSWYQEAVPLNGADDLADDEYVTAWKLWRALAYTEARDLPAARAAWSHLRLPGELDAWRHVALGATALQAGEVHAAVEALYRARGLDEHNPLAAYFLAQARVKQAETAREWYDAAGPRGGLFIRLEPQDISPNSREMYLRAAREEFHRAIEWAAELDTERSLLNVPWVEAEDAGAAMPLAVPTVRNLLAAIDAEHFLGCSHRDLGRLYLNGNAVETAEKHLDTAFRLETAVRDEYRALGRRYELLGRPLDAARAHLKAMREGGPIIDPTRSILRNLKDIG